MIRLVRVARMARLLKAMPELVILIKGIKAATRAVVVFVMLWVILVYVFAILCKQLTMNEPIGVQYFDTVPEAMATLFLDGVLPNFSELTSDVLLAKPILFPIIMFFILLAGVTIMYMLVGVLVDVVAAIAGAEKEGQKVSDVAEDMRDAFKAIQRPTETPITLFELNKLILEPDIIGVLTDAEVDIVCLLDSTDMIFEDPENDENGLSFEKFLDIVLNLRNSSVATVKDCKEQLRAIKKMVAATNEVLVLQMRKQFKETNDNIWDMMEQLADSLEKDNEGSEEGAEDAAEDLE